MKKKYTFLGLMFLLLVSKTINAQINYSFSAASGTFNSIQATGTAVTLTSFSGFGAPNDEGYNNSVPIGFTFTYNGSPFTSAKVCTNGFLALGTNFTTTGNGYYSNNLATGPTLSSGSATARRPIIAPLWDDLDMQASGNIRYLTTGTSPNQVCTIQWTNAKWDYNSSASTISFQVKLYETTNIIEFIYSQGAGTVGTASGGASIGITAAGTGANNFISLQDVSASPSISKTVEVNNITTKPAEGQIYRFTPITQLANDAAIGLIYTYGKIISGAPTVISATILNLGSSAQTNLPVTLNITGTNTFTNTQTIASLAANASTTVTFASYTPATNGATTVTISIPSDNDNTNNSSSLSQSVSSNIYSTAYSTTPQGGVGNTSVIEFASKFLNTSSKSIEQVSLYFTAGSAALGYDVSIYDASGTGGTPGATALWTLTGQTAVGAGIVNIPVTGVTVSGDFFLAVKQTGTTNLGYGYETENPIRSGVFYLKTTGSWTDLAANTANVFKFMMDVQFAAPVPITLSSFTGERKTNSSNLLSWTTATEINNNGFELQRSADGVNFSSLGFIASKASNGNSNAVLNYTFTDAKSLIAGSYYRLKQMDKDGKSTLSQVVFIKGVKVNTLQLVSVYPNPAIDKLNIALVAPKADNITFVVSDLTGKVIIRQMAAVSNGDNNIAVNVSTLAKGTYTIKAICADGCETAISKFVKQ